MRRMAFTVISILFVVTACNANNPTPSPTTPLSLPTVTSSPSAAPTPSASPQVQNNFVYVVNVQWSSNLLAIAYDVKKKTTKIVNFQDAVKPRVTVDAKNPAILANVFVAKTADGMTNQDYIVLQDELKKLLAGIASNLNQATPPTSASLVVLRIMYLDTTTAFFVIDYKRVNQEYAKGTAADWDSVLKRGVLFNGLSLPVVDAASVYSPPKATSKP